VTEFHDVAAKLPPIKILICVGDEDISIRISDLGGGISRRVEVDHLFT
jgi:hypothetical protein